MGALWACCLSLYFAGCSRTSGPTENELAAHYTEVLKQLAPEAKIERLDVLTLSFTDTQGLTRRIFLNNCFSECQQSPTEWESIARRYAAAAIEPIPATDPTTLLSRIVPIVKDRAWLTEIASRREGKDKRAPDFVTDQLTAELVIVYAEDSEQNVRYVGSADVESLKIPRQELRALAVENLRRLLPEMKIHSNGGLYMVTAGGTYEASILLFKDLWQERRIPVRGEYVVAIPSRDMLLVSGSEDRDGLAQLREISQKVVNEGNYTLTADLFVYRNDQFVKFAP